MVQESRSPEEFGVGDYPDSLIGETIVSPDRIATLVQTQYGLDLVAPPTLLDEGTHRRHYKFLIDTNGGRFIVKTYPRDLHVLDALRFQHRLSDHLLQSGLPVARIRRTREGRGYAEMEQLAVELQQFIEGHALRPSYQALKIAAETLGRFHESCRDFPCPPRDARMWRFSEVPREALVALYDRAKCEGDTTKVTVACNEIVLFLRHAADALNESIRNRFETGVIHGDYHAGNLLFQDDNLMGIIDLEYAGGGCFLEDLAYAASSLCVRSCVDPHHLAQRFDLLEHAYQQHRSLSFAEERALFYAVGIKHVTTVAFQTLAGKQRLAGYDAAQWMELLVAQCAFLSARARRK